MTLAEGFHLYLVRHGESANNALPDHQRVPDPDLTSLGHKQARQLAEHYREFDRIDHVLASPFRRTLQTAQPLLKAQNKQAVIWTDLYEVGGCISGHEAGKLTGQPGMTDREIKNEFPQFEVPPDIDHTGWYKSRPFETWDMAIPRAKAQAKKLIQTFAHQNAVVFCFIHHDFKQLLLQQLVPHQSDYHNGGISNSSVTCLHLNGTKSTVIDYCNTDHLESDDISY